MSQQRGGVRTHALIYTGSMEFVTVNLLVSAFNPFATLMLALMMGTRHLFYGLSMLGRHSAALSAGD